MDQYDDNPSYDLVAPSDWITQTCSAPGCTVVIRSRIGKQAPGNPICRWCADGTTADRNISLERLRNERKRLAKARTPLKEEIEAVIER